MSAPSRRGSSTVRAAVLTALILLLVPLHVFSTYNDRPGGDRPNARAMSSVRLDGQFFSVPL